MNGHDEVSVLALGALSGAEADRDDNTDFYADEDFDGTEDVDDLDDEDDDS